MVMNVHLKKCEIVDKFGEITKVNSKSIRGNSISMILLPEKLSLSSVLSGAIEGGRKSKSSKIETTSAALGIKATKSSHYSRKPRAAAR